MSFSFALSHAVVSILLRIGYFACLVKFNSFIIYQVTIRSRLSSLSKSDSFVIRLNPGCGLLPTFSSSWEHGVRIIYTFPVILKQNPRFHLASVNPTLEQFYDQWFLLRQHDRTAKLLCRPQEGNVCHRRDYGTANWLKRSVEREGLTLFCCSVFVGWRTGTERLCISGGLIVPVQLW